MSRKKADGCSWEQNVPHSLEENYPDERMHFMRTKKIVRLDSSSKNNGQN